MSRKKETMDGNRAAAHVSYAYSEVAVIYPITPSTGMAEAADEWSEAGRRNIFGETVRVTEMQSEIGAAGAMHGSLTAGALTVTYTASQGLLLMLPNLYKMAGEHLPGVIHVAARAIASHALSIFGDHQDIYACRQSGVAMLASGSVQEVMDLAVAAHGAAISGRLPFIHFFDGFRTSHEMQKIEVWEPEDLRELIDLDAIAAFRRDALNPVHARLMGSAQNPDIFFQAREASNLWYEALPGIVEGYLKKINWKIGTDYGLFNYYGAGDAREVMIAMGSVCGTIEEVVDSLNEAGGKTGLVKVRLYRPFSVRHFLAALPDTVERLIVLDRTKEPGAVGEPLYLDVCAALQNSAFANVRVFSGRYGLGSKDTAPSQIFAAFANCDKRLFTIGIEDDVTHLSLRCMGEAQKKTGSRMAEAVTECKFWGLGGDGTVSANKNSIKIIGDHTDLYVQAYFEYDSKKSRGVTISHLRFGSTPVRAAYLIDRADFVACHNPAYIRKYHMVQEVKDGGVFLLNSPWTPEELEEKLPGQVKRYMARHNIRFFIIDGNRIGKEIGLNGKINTILQSAFFALTDLLPKEEALARMKEAAKKSYIKKGEKVIRMNYEAIDRGAAQIIQVKIPEQWAKAEDEPLHAETCEDREEVMEYVNKIQKAINSQEGNKLPVSAFLPYADGRTPSGTTAHERRDVAVDLPEWIPENCIQCNRCSLVCPHAVIRPAVMNKEEQKRAPGGMKQIPMNGLTEYAFSIVISRVDCTGCGSCVGVCPGMRGNKALVMTPAERNTSCQECFDYGKELPEKREIFAKFSETAVKGSQFKKPLHEFSGACAGCGETPYVKLITQLFGERMYIANATGCSSIWGNSSPSTSYAANREGHGPAWSNSLFEDAAEFGYGMLLAQNAIRERMRKRIREEKALLGDAAEKWLETYEEGVANGEAARELIREMEKRLARENVAENADLYREILAQKEFLPKKSQWVFGGDGWAYDIGFGGLDHVLAAGQDINLLVLDTEVYSNTGGQASKATPAGAVAAFEVGGKRTGKKDLAGMAMNYGNVYVAQIAMGADFDQTIRAITEAERYRGPSLILAYAPCISHGIKAGMGSAQHEEAKAVEAGYWHLFRYHPEKGFTLDSREPSLEYEEFLAGENRYDFLRRSRPEAAEELFSRAAEAAQSRYRYLKSLENGTEKK